MISLDAYLDKIDSMCTQLVLWYTDLIYKLLIQTLHSCVALTKNMHKIYTFNTIHSNLPVTNGTTNLEIHRRDHLSQVLL